VIAVATIEEPPDLFELGQQAFAAYTAELAERGVPVSPDLELRRGEGVICYYQPDHNAIYLSMPSPSEPMYPIHMMVWASILSVSDQLELERFLRLFVQRIVAHELGHAARDHYGKYGSNLWEEEQIANQLAVALQNRRLTPEDHAFFLRFVDGAVAALVARVGTIDRVRASYTDQLEAMVQAGEFGTSTMMSLEALAGELDLPPSELLDKQVSTGAQRALSERQATIEHFNSAYMSDPVPYFYFQLGWLQIDLVARHTHYVEEFAAKHLGVQPALLPRAELGRFDEDGVIACHQAYRACRGTDPCASRWFYKRYRAQLIALLEGADLKSVETAGASTPLFRGDSSVLLEAWDEERSDRLDMLSGVAPPALAHLFPSTIGERTVDSLLAALPNAGDRSLARLVLDGADEPAAAHTLHRLRLIDRASVFRALPAAVVLDLAAMLIELPLAPDEPLMWQGDQHNDVFIVSEGELEWAVASEAGTRTGRIGEGEVVGEIAFLTQQRRTASVRAVGHARVFVVKATDLRRLAHQHPSIMEHIAAALARRLAAMTAG